MKKHMFFAVVFMLIFTFSAAAHPGRTDAFGGHRDNNNVSGLGPYHYHHGYGPHLHPSDVCPYDFNDATNHSSGGSSGASIGTATITSDRYDEGYGDGYDEGYAEGHSIGYDLGYEACTNDNSDITTDGSYRTLEIAYRYGYWDKLIESYENDSTDNTLDDLTKLTYFGAIFSLYYQNADEDTAPKFSNSGLEVNTENLDAKYEEGYAAAATDLDMKLAEIQTLMDEKIESTKTSEQPNETTNTNETESSADIDPLLGGTIAVVITFLVSYVPVKRELIACCKDRANLRNQVNDLKMQILDKEREEEFWLQTFDENK